jgi:hypothetical protein
MATASVSLSSVEFVLKLKKTFRTFPKIRIKHSFLKRVCSRTGTIDRSA